MSLSLHRAIALQCGHGLTIALQDVFKDQRVLFLKSQIVNYLKTIEIPVHKLAITLAI